MCALSVIQYAPDKVKDEPRDAESCFDESLDIFTRIQMDSERARTLRDWARHELANGERERGMRLWREAREAFHRLGMTLELERMSEENK